MGKYETEFKLKVVKSFLAGEGGAKLLARRWSVPEEKVRTWVSHYRLHGITGLQPKRGAYTVVCGPWLCKWLRYPSIHQRTDANSA